MRTPKNCAVRLAPLLLLAASLIGCATPSPPMPPIVSPSPKVPAPDPRLMTPEPAIYSDSVRKSLSKWADMLTGSPAK